jgi:hypothetical protein
VHDQGLTFCRLVQIPKQGAREDAEEPEPEPKKRTVTVVKLTEGFGLTDKLASRSLMTLGGRSGEWHQLDKELWGCVLTGWEVI